VVGEGDLAAQVEQCFLNVANALAGVSATFDHVAKLTVYFADWHPDKVADFTEGVARAAARLGVDSLSRPPLTGIGVATLAEPGLLVEVEATAVLD
jgi:enamine deaminase RidA (YjgF/YER057c/UK114 family)